MPRERDLQKEAFWRQVVQDQAASGLSIRAWCDKRRLRQKSFFRWRRELRRRGAGRVGPHFAPVHVTEDHPREKTGRIEIVLSGGSRVRLHGRVDCQLLGEVVALLTSMPSADGEGRSC